MVTRPLATLAVLAQLAYGLALPENIIPKRTPATDILSRAYITNKAGLSGYVGIQNTAAFKALAPYMSWYSDYSPTTPDAYVGSHGVQGFPMLWGATGSPCTGVAADLSNFTNLVSQYTPPVMFGFYEPDCYCPDSSQMTVAQAQTAWNTLMAPIGAKGTTLGSPSMCKQLDEDFLTPFMANITRMWDVTSIHINVPTLDLVKADVAYYRKYNRPIFVSEFACVDARNGWAPCTNQTQINQFVAQAVAYFQSQSDILGFGPSNGNGLGSVWPLTNSSGGLTATGQAYLTAIRGY